MYEIFSFTTQFFYYNQKKKKNSYDSFMLVKGKGKSKAKLKWVEKDRIIYERDKKKVKKRRRREREDSIEEGNINDEKSHVHQKIFFAFAQDNQNKFYFTLHF